MNTRKTLTLIFGLAVFCILGFFAFNQYIYNQKQSPPTILPPFTGEITGEYVCLPHKNTKGPQTEECAFGVRVDDGVHMALDLGSDIDDLSQFQAGKRATLSGHFTPVQALSTDQWSRYDIVGILKVGSSSAEVNP